MIDWDTELGQRIQQRIATEQVIWLTTVSPSGFPQPRPVWFVWDGATFLIYSMPTAKKIVHIAHNPQVALHFDSGENGEDVQVILGTAVLHPEAPSSKNNAAYSQKYGDAIVGLGMDEETYSALFSAAIQIVPSRARGLEPLPDF